MQKDVNIEVKVFESYVSIPNDLRAWKGYIIPILCYTSTAGN